MSCRTEDCGCGYEEFVELASKKSLPMIEEAQDCGDGSCGCGCDDLLEKKESGPAGRHTDRSLRYSEKIKADS